MKKAVIIGGGLAGLSLATELVDENFEVTVLEKKSYLGGRASNTFDRKMDDPVPIGPHIFLAAYNNFRHFLKKVKAEESISWEKKLLSEIVYNGKHHQTKVAYLSGPLWFLSEILRYKFISLKDKLSNLVLGIPVLLYSGSQIDRLDQNSAYDFLRKWWVSKKAIDKFWRFFVFSMLNVPLEICSAAELLLLTQHWTKTKFSQFGFSKVGLGDLYAKKSEEYLKKMNGSVWKKADVKEIVWEGEKIRHLIVEHEGQTKKLAADLFVSTLNPIELRELLPKELASSDFFKHLWAFEPVPYISVNLWFDRKVTHKKFWALLNDSYPASNMNTDFYDQSNIYKTRKKNSFITSNIIYSQPYQHLSEKEIVNKTLSELKETFPVDAKLVHYEIHRIPYVIYAPHPGMRQHKLSHKTPVANFYLAGDWTVKELTQCIESAVRSGYYCAEEILKDMGINKKICDPKIG